MNNYKWLTLIGVTLIEGGLYVENFSFANVLRVSLN